MKEEIHDTLSGQIISWIKSPINNYKKLKKLTAFENNNDNDIVWALKDISFSIKVGEVVGVIGRNGAGKSTLLKILSQITNPTSGIAKINGRVASLLEVGTGFHPELTGRENIYLNGTILGMKKIEIDNKFDDIVEFSEVRKFIDTPVKRYSSGMRVRLAFAIAANLDPEILLIDEVLAVGDVDFQNKCLNKMENITSQGRTILFVSHNMLAVQNLCSKSILIEDGQISFIGDTKEALNKYHSQKVDPDFKGEITWYDKNIPGDDRITLSSVSLFSGGVITASPKISDKITLSAKYLVHKSGYKWVTSFHIVNSMGITVLTSSNLKGVSLFNDPYADTEYETGKYSTSMVIPEFLLNNGDYSVKLFIQTKKHMDKPIVIDEVISFSVVDEIDMRKEFTGKWIGVIRPKLDWETKKI